MKRILIALLLLAPGAFGQAAAVYLAPSAAGSANGTSCANAYAYTFANSSGNYGTGGTQIGPGTTVHFCSGTYTAAAGANLITLPNVSAANGASGNPITWLFDSGAAMQAPYFSSATGAIDMAGRSYEVINGGTNGTIENTLDGSSGATCLGGTCSYQQATKILQIYSCTGCVVENLTIADVYIHTQCEAASGCDTTLSDFSSATAINFSGDGFAIHNNVIHDTGACTYSYSVSSGESWSIYDNECYNMDHGFFGGPNPGVANLGTIKIYGNNFHDSVNWDTGSADLYHHDGIHYWDGKTFLTGGGTTNELDIYNNVFHGDEGQCCITSWIYEEGMALVNNIYNNVLVGPTTISVPGGEMEILSADTAHTFTVNLYNNTFINRQPAGGTGACYQAGGANGATITINAEDNAFTGCNAYWGLSTDYGATFPGINYNVYANDSGGGNHYWGWNGASGGTSTFATWQSHCNCDANASAQTSSALNIELTDQVTAPYIGEPATGFLGAGIGADLTSTATGGLAALSSDTSLGNNRTPILRPTGTTAWDAGAYVATLQVATPTFSPAGGNYASQQTITISDGTSGATICYRTDGVNPTTSSPGTCGSGSTTYTSSFSSVASGNETVKALGTKSGYIDSSVASVSYCIGAGCIATSPVIPAKLVIIANEQR